MGKLAASLMLLRRCGVELAISQRLRRKCLPPARLLGAQEGQNFLFRSSRIAGGSAENIADAAALIGVEFQAVQIRLAEMQMRVDAARLLIHRAACNAQDGLPSILESSVAKCFANEIAREVCGHAVQLMGGYGYSREYPMERRLRDAWGWGIAGGAVDIQKVNIAGAMVGKRFDQRR